MANTTINIPKPHLIMGLCLPLAVLLGYFLAEPMESGSLAVVLIVVGVLCVPILMKWHHPLLVICWNAWIYPAFLPGRPALWILMALVGLLFAVLNRSVNPTRRFLHVPSVTKSLIFLGFVVAMTAIFTGGFGIRAMGSDRYGGKGYFYIFAAIIGYFAFTSRRIPPQRARIYVALFFLSGLTASLSTVIEKGGPAFHFLFSLVPRDGQFAQAADPGVINPGMGRIGGVALASTGLYACLLARYGVRGILEFSRPMRAILVAVSVAGCLFGGYRSLLILFILTFGFCFWLEGLWRTRVLPILVGAALLGTVLLLPQVERLPFVVQRSLSFLPLKVDPAVRLSAESSTEWRLEMWRMVAPQIPRYWLKGKGYSLDPNELFLTVQSTIHGFESSSAGSSLAGDYHNGALSVLIPFGIWGVIGFGWFLYAAGRVLYYNCRFGNPALQSINTFLMAFFIAKLVLFLLVFGSFFSDLYFFTGLVGLSVSLNGEPGIQPETAPAENVLNSFPQPV
jgi:hypothetical protein